MNWDQIEGNWKQFEGKVKSQWGKITDDDWKMVEGKKDQLLGKIQERYGHSKEAAEKELDEFCSKLSIEILHLRGSACAAFANEYSKKKPHRKVGFCFFRF